MPKCKVVKGGWSWLGAERRAGDILDAPSEQWVSNRAQDGLVEPIAEPAPAAPEVKAASAVADEVEVAAIAPPEVAVVLMKKPKRKW